MDQYILWLKEVLLSLSAKAVLLFAEWIKFFVTQVEKFVTDPLTIVRWLQRTVSSPILHGCGTCPSLLHLNYPTEATFCRQKHHVCLMFNYKLLFSDLRCSRFTAFNVTQNSKTWDTFSKLDINKLVLTVDEKHIIVPLHWAMKWSGSAAFAYVRHCEGIIFFFQRQVVWRGFLIETIILSTWFASEHLYLTIMI